MEGSVQSVTDSPISPPSPSFSDSSANDSASIASERVPKQEATNSKQRHAEIAPLAQAITQSRPASRSSASSGVGVPQEYAGASYGETASCMWDDCGSIFTQLPTLIEHIHSVFQLISGHKSQVTHVNGRLVRGAAFLKRLALHSFLTSVLTLAKSHISAASPMMAISPECDKSFTRSDALAKHMRQQHHIEPPAPGRGGSRKRKRNAEDATVPPADAINAGATSGFSTFKVEPDVGTDEFPHTFVNGRSSRPGSPCPGGEEGDGDSPSDDHLPTYLAQHFEPETGLVMGRTPAMVMYLLMKAKHRYAVKEHESLLEELRVARAELKREKEQKEMMLDRYLFNAFGSQHAEPLVTPIQPPPGIALTASPEPQSLPYANTPPVLYPPTNGFGR
ncbi:hypothetical protein APHAL10511_003031 [Amanita phalloides]|nr:hypothetical protein APHAL10511_003031 [Amanita phalloides]